MVKNVRIEGKIGGEVGLIKFFDILSPDSDFHNYSELPNDENLDFLAKKWCLNMERLRENRK